jgi:caa(3)-type oxidase subunit IV
MSSDHTVQNLKTYWQIWGKLLALTVVMLFLDQAPLPPTLFVVIMVAAMLTKASLIAAYFMHLKYEHRFLQATFVVGLVINATFMFALFIPDAVRIYHMLNG